MIARSSASTRRAAAALPIATGGCGITEHEDRQAVHLGMSRAANEPNGGNYAKAVAIVEASDRPADVRAFRIGRLIVGSFADPRSRRPAGTLQQGLAHIEQAALTPAVSRDVAQQQLRLLFERGRGTNPNRVPLDRPVRDCWYAIGTEASDDPARCVTLRRHRLPHLSP